MQVFKYILITVDIIVSLILIVVIMLQHQEDSGLSSTFTGAASENFLDKNKGRTRQGILKKWTIILAIVFAVLSIILNIIYAL